MTTYLRLLLMRSYQTKNVFAFARYKQLCTPHGLFERLLNLADISC